MFQNKTIKQLEEKNVAQEIEFLSWSGRTDLIALSNVKGEVALHRLTWIRAWSLPPHIDGSRVKCLAWSPDGKILTVAYSTGHVLLISVENKNTVHKIVIQENISCMYWAQEKTETKSDKTSEREEQDAYMKYLDYSSAYLPDPPLLRNIGSNSSEDNTKTNILQEQTELNLLLIGTKEGFLHISIFGCFPCIVLNLNEYLGRSCSVEAIHLSDSLNNMLITVKDEADCIEILIVSCAIFKTHKKELFALAYKHERLVSLINYLSNTIIVIKETWENILFEIDAKLSKYASKVPEGGVTADFLDLLMFGISCNEMEEFLVYDLTKKGVEKFGQTIELSYENIQKLLLKYVTKTGQNITYHLAELRGLARLEHRYKVLGLSEEKINEAISSNGSFLIKCGEMQQIINHSIVNYKAFFRWLYAAVMNLLDEPIPPEIPKMTQQDLANITEFLQNFDKIGIKNDFTNDNSRNNGFIMERLGQYLIDAPLTTPPKTEGNDWSTFVSKNKCIQNHPSILKHHINTSLIQQFRNLGDTIDEIFTQPKNIIKNQCKLMHRINCCSYPEKSFRMCSVNFTDEVVFCAFLSRKPPTCGVYFIAINIYGDLNLTGAYILFPQIQCSNKENYQVMDVKFYSPKILSVLLQENELSKVGAIYQLFCGNIHEQFASISLNVDIVEQDLPQLNFYPVLFRNIDNFIVSEFAVSGSRKLCIVLSENRKKVRLFEMEAEEDDEDDIDTTNCTVRESDVTMHESSITE